MDRSLQVTPSFPFLLHPFLHSDSSPLDSTEDVLISQLLDPNNETSIEEVRDLSSEVSSAQLGGEEPPFHSTSSPFREEEVERALKTS